MKSIIVLAFCLLVSVVNAKEEKKERISYCTTLQEALQQANKENKPVFFNCYAAWAGPSVLMDSVVLTDPALVKFIRKHFVSLRVDMTKTEEGRKLAEQYGVQSYAHFLILDKQGNVQHRIIGGSKAPEFEEKLKRGLNPKTSLAGMNRRYAKGERSLKFLADYAGILSRANEKAKYQEVTDYYFTHVDTAGMFLPRSWEMLKRRGEKYNSEWYDFVYRHREPLMQANGRDQVTDFIIKGMFQQIFPCLNMDALYDQAVISEIERKIGTLDTASTSRNQLRDMCRILDLREQKKYSEMLDVWVKLVPGLPNAYLKVVMDRTLGNLQDMSGDEKKRAVGYLNERMREVTGNTLKQYEQIVRNLDNYQGIVFEHGSLQEALDKARKEKKAVFVDCFTSWCGPCKMMSSKVFPDKRAGDYFNPRFVSIKIDMEKGEGKALAAKWQVRAFPTYLILDDRGKVVYTTRGYIPAEELIKRMKEGLEQWKK